ncbi:serpentine type 7TM GPCR chemoreceptor srx domain-containing protein [Ditylenchus destructor]|uniref:Serpentine type 7TM GPCR chemoreceptor srx domain-containing protein n=1 Tax=Ditylenchus destructor TaxID=166010 RepID=A0AAD4N8T1_9BILA|nr:serpentine type 7TM GPCR chemoreceptor srx domain-containing protein [Ditylenchus destructor]
MGDPCMNSTSIASASPDEVPEVLIVSSAFRAFGASTYMFLALTSIFMNLILIFVFIQAHQKFKRLAFFTIAWQMVVCDLMCQTIQLIIAVPITYTGRQVYGETLWLYGFGFFDTVAYNATLYFSFLMTLNRITVFFASKINYYLFSKPWIYFTIGFMWIFVFAFVAGINLIGCFYYYHDCIPCISAFGQALRRFSSIMSTYLPVVMLIAYTAIFIAIRCFTPDLPTEHGRTTMHAYERAAEVRYERIRRKREIGFVIQSFLICGFLEVQNLSFNAVPYLHIEGEWSIMLNFLENWISILLNSISPVILFTFNEEIRKQVRDLFRQGSQLFRDKSTTVATSMISPGNAAVLFNYRPPPPPYNI